MNILKNKKIKILSKILFDKHRKSLWQIYKDIKWFKNKSPFKDKSLDFYFECLVYKKNAGKLEHYLPKSVYLSFKNNTPVCKHHGKHPILGDKVAFKEFAMKNNLMSAKYLGYIKKGILTIADTQEHINISYESRVKSTVENWINENKTLFVKESNTWMGGGVTKIDNWEQFSKMTFKNNESYLIEAKIFQSETLNKINPNCVLGLRVYTLLKDNIPIVLASHLRTGYKTSYIDTTKGINVRYDIVKNKLEQLGHQSWKFGGKSYSKHPFTAYEFNNQPLPYPDKVIELCKKAATLFPDQRLIGWDIAYTDQGAVIIEGNDSPDIQSMQITFKGLLSNLYFRELYEEYFNENGTLKISLA